MPPAQSGGWGQLDNEVPRTMDITGTWSRRRSIGKSAKDWMEKSIKAKTEMSSTSRDARTTDAEIAPFIDNTEDSLVVASALSRYSYDLCL